MKLELCTERLLLTPLASTDVDIALVMFIYPEVTEYVDGVMSAETINKDISDWIKRGGNGCIGFWCISDRKSGVESPLVKRWVRRSHLGCDWRP